MKALMSQSCIPRVITVQNTEGHCGFGSALGRIGLEWTYFSSISTAGIPTTRGSVSGHLSSLPSSAAVPSIPRHPDRQIRTCCRLQVNEGDRFLPAFLSRERSLLGLAWGHLQSAGLGSLESRQLPSLSYTLQRRLAAMRAMLLVPRAISLRAWALRGGLLISPAGCGVFRSKPAVSCSLESRLLEPRAFGFCERKQRPPSDTMGPQKQSLPMQSSWKGDFHVGSTLNTNLKHRGCQQDAEDWRREKRVLFSKPPQGSAF